MNETEIAIRVLTRLLNAIEAEHHYLTWRTEETRKQIKANRNQANQIRTRLKIDA